MHLSVRLPRVLPEPIQPPPRCPLEHGTQPSQSRHFKVHQVVCRKRVRDTKYKKVTAQRYRCLKCGDSLRVYPEGVSNAHMSQRLQAPSVLLYILGLSYQSVADLLVSLEQPISKSTAYNNVQAAGTRAQVLRKTREKAMAGQRYLGAVATALLTGELITFDILEAEAAFRVERWLQDLARVLGTEILVTDDADGLKTVADHPGLKHQMCRAQVNRNVHTLIVALGTKALEHPDPVPWGLSPLTLEQFVTDLQDLEWIIQSMSGNGLTQMNQLAERYRSAPPPPQGQKATMWYRMRLLTHDRSENWARLALYESSRTAKNETLDGTNNVCEQIIGQCVKERYRTMPGYKRRASILNVSSLIGWARTRRQGFDMTESVSG